MRLEPELADWLAAYASERGVSKSALLHTALRSFRADCESGVPEIERPVRRPAARESRAEPWGAIMAERQQRVNRLGRSP